MRIETVADLGRALGAQRRSHGLRQSELALASGTGPRFVHDLERGKATVRLGTVLRVAAALGLTLELRDRARGFRNVNKMATVIYLLLAKLDFRLPRVIPASTHGT